MPNTYWGRELARQLVREATEKAYDHIDQKAAMFDALLDEVAKMRERIKALERCTGTNQEEL